MENKTNKSITWKNRPKEWEDDTRMNALFATFRPRELNPVYYDAKLKFWKETIQSVTNENDLLLINESELVELFIRNGIKPKCLDIVIQEMIKESKIFRMEEFLQTHKSWKDYFSEKLWSPVILTKSYLSRILFYSHESHNSQNSMLVIKDVLHRKSFELLKSLQENIMYPEIECIVDYNKFTKVCNQHKIQEATQIEIILMYLMSAKKALVITHDNHHSNKLIKFTSNDVNSVKPVTDLERSYYLLKLTESKLMIELDKYQADIDQKNEQIKEQLKKQKKMDALATLKKRKRLEKTLEGKYEILENIHSMLINIEQSDTNKTTLNIYKTSLDALKEANKSFDLDHIDDTLSEIQDLFTQNKEINQMLSMSLVQDSNDIVNLENELNDLLNESKLSQNKNDDSVNDALSKLDKLHLNDVLEQVLNDSFDKNNKKSALAN